MPSPDLAQLPVRTPAELTRRWADLLEPPLFGSRSLWLAWVGANGVMPPILVPVDDVPAEPDPRLLAQLLEVHQEVVDLVGGGAHLALALARPGAARPTGDDERWADLLRATVPGRITETWSLHLAAGGELNPLVDPPWPRTS